MTPAEIQARAEAAAAKALNTCDLMPQAGPCLPCIASVIVEELRQSEAKVEALLASREAWVRMASSVRVTADRPAAWSAAEAADARARECGAL